MALKDFAGVFSRYFVIGFFLPSFFVLVALSQVLDEQALPRAYRDASDGTQLLILGGVALLTGLLLSGVHYPVLRLYEGYPLKSAEKVPVVGGLYRFMVGRKQKAFDKLDAQRAEPERSPERTKAAQRLAQQYPTDREQLLPTRFGNTVRSFERHPRARYGLDGVTIWPRIAMLLSEEERELVGDEQTDVAFFINASLLALLAGALLVADAAWHGVDDVLAALLYAIPFLISYLAYRAVIGAAVRWGEPVRAAFDLHRYDLYAKLGTKIPATDEDERAVAKAINRCLLYGEPIPDDLRDPHPPKEAAHV